MRSQSKKTLLAALIVIATMALYFVARQIYTQAKPADSAAAGASAAKSSNTPLQPDTAEISTIPRANATPRPPSAATPLGGMLADSSAIAPDADLQVCGLSQAEAQRIEKQRGAINMTSASMAMAQPVAALMQSDTVEKKALGLYLEALRAGWNALDVGTSAGANIPKKPECEGNDNCAADNPLALQKLLHAATQKAVAPLVALALNSKNPTVYATAFYACELDGARESHIDNDQSSSATTTKPASCAAITVADWAALDSNNVVPWMLFAGETANTLGGSRRDGTQQDALSASLEVAINRAVLAPQYKARFPAVATLFDDDQLRMLSPLLQAAFATEIIGLQQAQTPAQNVASYCATPHFGLEKRRLNCHAIANKMLELDTNFAGLNAAITIGKGLRWNSARLTALSNEYKVATMLHSEQTASSIKLNCENVATLNAYLQSVLRKGERAVSSELIAKSGKTLAELIALRQ